MSEKLNPGALVNVLPAALGVSGYSNIQTALHYLSDVKVCGHGFKNAQLIIVFGVWTFG